MFHQHRLLCLASTSPRRKEFLERYGLQFECWKPLVDETPLPGESVENYVTRLAKDKATDASQHFPESIILAGDTTVYHNHEIIGKPESRAQAIQMLHRLSGEIHVVYSAYAILDAKTGKCVEGLVQTMVKFRTLDDSCIESYVRTGDPMDKAGAYSLQGLGSFLVERIDGSYNNVIGFPVEEILPHLIQHEWLSCRIFPSVP
ncbi:MAG: septum formation protein Maf [SAR324 cluster bacterium]|nr:septum formation protein Maf [SAR324 cluster bacterium]